MSTQKQEIIQQFEAADEARRDEILQQGCEQAVAAWEEHTAARTIEYLQDGARLVLDTSLPRRSMDEAARKMSGLPSRRARAIGNEWEGPLQAIEHDALAFPKHIVAAYQAVHLLFYRVFELEPTPAAEDVLAKILQSQPETE